MVGYVYWVFRFGWERKREVKCVGGIVIRRELFLSYFEF